MAYSTLTTTLDQSTLIVTINRPEKMNALNRQVFTDLDNVMDEIAQDKNIRSAIITGAGEKAFVAGADITEFNELSKSQAMELAQRGQDVFFKIENSAKPVIAAVNGFALGGGCELAMACHFRICSDNAKFGQPEVNLGLIPGYGGTQRLTQIVGKGRSMQIQMTGAMVNAEEAYRIGLVNQVTTMEQLLPTAKEILQMIHTKAPLAISKVIECINTAMHPDSPLAGFKKEVACFGECIETQDMKEGTAAFLEKRKAVFTGQ